MTPPADSAMTAALTATRQVIRDRLACTPSRAYRALLRQTLARPGRLLARAAPLWARLPLTCAAAAGGHPAAAVPVAAALEVIAAALELLDDLEDGDLPADDPLRAHGLPRLANATTGLLTIGLSLLPTPADAALADMVLLAAAGQDADLAGEGAGLREAACVRIAAAKSAGLPACGARLGALAGGATEEQAAAYERFGRHFGLAAQFHNDLRAADPDSVHNDLERRKPTVLLAAAGLAGPAATPPETTETLIERLHASGAVDYVWLLAEAEWQQALAELDTLAAAGHAVEPLRRLVAPQRRQKSVLRRARPSRKP
jgi:geranylgeranyl pyrophosphate synthase